MLFDIKQLEGPDPGNVLLSLASNFPKSYDSNSTPCEWCKGMAGLSKSAVKLLFLIGGSLNLKLCKIK